MSLFRDDPIGSGPSRPEQLVAIVSIAWLVDDQLRRGARPQPRQRSPHHREGSGLATLPIFALIAADVTPEWTPVVSLVPRPLAGFGVAMIAVLWADDGRVFVT